MDISSIQLCECILSLAALHPSRTKPPSTQTSGRAHPSKNPADQDKTMDGTILPIRLHAA